MAELEEGTRLFVGIAGVVASRIRVVKKFLPLCENSVYFVLKIELL